jgi:hypothetical protein
MASFDLGRPVEGESIADLRAASPASARETPPVFASNRPRSLHAIGPEHILVRTVLRTHLFPHYESIIITYINKRVQPILLRRNFDGAPRAIQTVGET